MDRQIYDRGLGPRIRLSPPSTPPRSSRKSGQLQSPTRPSRLSAEKPPTLDSIVDDDSLTASQKDLALRVAYAAKRIHQWHNELERWRWTGRFDLDETDLDLLTPGLNLVEPEVAQNASEKISDQAVSMNDVQLREYEEKLDDIYDELPTLDMDDLKERILDIHTGNSRPSSRGSNLTISNLSFLDDFSFYVTQTLIRSLPELSALSPQLKSWSTRLMVMRQVPRFIHNYKAAAYDMLQAWRSLDVQLDEDDTLNHIQIERQRLDGVKGKCYISISATAGVLDTMLDSLEGQEDTLPDRWIDAFEAVEADFANWCAAAHHRIYEANYGPPALVSSTSNAIGGEISPNVNQSTRETHKSLGIADNLGANSDTKLLDDAYPTPEDPIQAKEMLDTAIHDNENASRSDELVSTSAVDLQITVPKISTAISALVTPEAVLSPPNSFLVANHCSTSSTPNPTDMTPPTGLKNEDQILHDDSHDLHDKAMIDPVANQSHIDHLGESNTKNLSTKKDASGVYIDEIAVHSSIPSREQPLTSGMSDINGLDTDDSIFAPVDSSTSEQILPLSPTIEVDDLVEDLAASKRLSNTSEHSSRFSEQSLLGNSIFSDLTASGDVTDLTEQHEQEILRRSDYLERPHTPDFYGDYDDETFLEDLSKLSVLSELDDDQFDSDLEDSPSQRKQPVSRAPKPPLNAMMKKRAQRDPNMRVSALKLDKNIPSPRRTPDMAQSPSQSPVSPSMPLELQISNILQAIHTPIRFRSGPKANAPDVKHSRMRTSSSTQSRRSSISRSGTPALTLAPADEPSKKSHANVSDIRLYHLIQAGQDKPIKLFIRRVGENGERVMVRVGGGWADLGEYLRIYAEHHGRRAVSEGRIEIQALNTGKTPPKAENRRSSLMSSASRSMTPTFGRSMTPTMGERARSSTPALVDRLIEPDSAKKTPRVASDTPQSIASASSRRSTGWDEVGMAGPRTRRGEMSEEKKEWVEGIIEQTKRGMGKNIEVGDLGKSGNTRRIFFKGRNSSGVDKP